MKPRKATDIKSSLLQKGFRQHDTDHSYFWFFYENRQTSIRTKVSYGIKEYGDNLLAKIRKQMRLGGRELDEFFDCDMTGDGYGQLLIERGHVKVTKKK